MRRFSSPLLLLLLVCGNAAHAKTSVEVLAHKAVSENATESATAISELRALGPEGFNALWRAHVDEIDRQIANPILASSPEWRRLTTALDTVSQQKDSYISGLYWFTDLDHARAAARAANKPILSLRLLGKLNEEFSCANSRFFRTILYSNAAVSKALRERFILHWESVRPAPRVTIDFGDGRKLERTLTGNSIHYVLDTDGRPIDALPGLYGPAAFMRSLAKMEEIFKALTNLNRRSIASLPAYLQSQLEAINLRWFLDIQKTGGKTPEGFKILLDENGTPTAIQAAQLAMTKALTEAPMLRSISVTREALGSVTDQATWNQIAALHSSDALLDDRSISLIKRQTHKALLAEGSKSDSDVALRKLIEKLQMSIVLDTVRNEYLMHTKIYEWLLADRSRRDVSALNKRVYDELFLTPASDPWLGLFSAETYMALENGGLRQ